MRICIDVGCIMDEEKQRIFGLRSQVEQYFDTQAQRLLEQARAASFLTTHSTVVGDAGEQGLRSFLRNHLPHRYGVGTGHIVSFRGSSAQVDTIILTHLIVSKYPSPKMQLSILLKAYMVP